jgi:Ca2+-transporting ATPase
VVAAVKVGLRETEMRLENPRVEEFPFSSERKRMTTIHQMNDGKRVAFMKGGPEIVLERCAHILEDGGIKEISQADRTRILKTNEEMAQSALRVLGFAYRECGGMECTEETHEHSMVFVGLAGMIDPPRQEAVGAIKVCEKVGIRSIDYGRPSVTAVAIAKEMGIYKEGDRVMTVKNWRKFLGELASS